MIPFIGSENALTFTIDKTLLHGLTPSPNNSADQLFSSILLSLLGELEGELEDSEGNRIVDSEDNSLAYDLRSDYPKINVIDWRKEVKGGYKIYSLVVQFRLPDTALSMDVNLL